jgi:penicillin-binding protein 1A
MRRLIALISSLFKLVFLGSFLVVVCASIILGVYGILAKEYDLKQLEHIASKTIPNDHQIIDFLKKQDPDSGYVSLDQVSSEFVEALIVREDTRFYSHKGIDPIGIIRASYRNIIKNKREGASTITMQLARNSFEDLMNQKNLHRKLIEAMLARRIEKEYSKKKILELYVNKIFFGSGIYGVEKASLSYFGKKAKDMNLSESAMLAGIIRGPNRFSPFRNYKDANIQRETVLRRMLEEERISIHEYQTAIDDQVFILKQKKL